MDPLTAAPTPNPKSKKVFLISSGIILVSVLVVGAIVYFWQQGLVKTSEDEAKSLKEKISSQDKEIGDFKKSTSELKTRVAFLEQALREATASSGQQVGNLTITVKSIERWDNPSTSGDDAWVVIGLDIKNNTQQALYYSKFAMKLKDSQNHSYSNPSDPYTKECAKVDDDSTCKSTGFVSIPDQGLQPGETVTGHVAFTEVPKTETKLTFYYADQAFPITAK